MLNALNLDQESVPRIGMHKKGSKYLLTRIFISIFISLTIITLGIAYWLWIDVKAERYADLKGIASVLKSYHELAFNQMEIGLLSVGERMLDGRQEKSYEEQVKIGKDALTIFEDFIAFGLADPDGQLMVFTGEESDTTSLPNLTESEESKRSFLRARDGQGLSIGEVYYFDAISDWIIPIRVPIRNDTGKLEAVNTSAISYESFVGQFETFNINPLYRVLLINKPFNTTQIYFPLRKEHYDEVLGASRDYFKDIVEESSEEFFTQFEAKSKFQGKPILGIRMPLADLEHDIIITVGRSIVWTVFWDAFRFILLAYFILSMATLGGYIFLNKKEKDLTAERDFSTNIIKSSPVLIVGRNGEGICTFINPAAEKITGYTQKEIVGKSWWKAVYPNRDKKAIQAKLQKFREENVRNYEMPLTTKSGETRLINWNSIRELDEDGNERLVTGFGIDVTDHRSAERMLIEREANLMSLFESTNSIIGLFDQNKRLIEFNQSFAEYAKHTDNVDMHKDMDILSQLNKPQADMFHAFLDRSLKGEKFKETIEYPTPDGQAYFLMSYNPIYRGEEIIGVSMFVEDITELKNSQKKLEKYTQDLEGLVKERTEELEDINKELKAGNEALYEQSKQLAETLHNLQEAQKQLIQSEKMASLGVLSAGIGHEINNPLNFIKGGSHGMLKMLKNEFEEVARKTTPFFEVIDEGVRRASKIVKSLSHFSRQGGNMEENCNIPDIIDNCLVMLHNRLKNKVDIIKSYEEQASIVTGNEGKLHQAFLNILSNSEQAINEEGAINISSMIDGENILIKIKDDGCGIAEDHITKISDPFFTTKPPGIGTGLGLSITYSIIEEHNGSIDVSSKINEGTEIIIRLPVAT